jgi:hypothetical protein
VIEPLFYASAPDCDLAQIETDLIAEFDCIENGYNTRPQQRRWDRALVKPTEAIIDLNRYFENPSAACVALGVSHATLYRRIAKGELHTIDVAGHRLIAKPIHSERT